MLLELPQFFGEDPLGWIFLNWMLLSGRQGHGGGTCCCSHGLLWGQSSKLVMVGLDLYNCTKLGGAASLVVGVISPWTGKVWLWAAAHYLVGDKDGGLPTERHFEQLAHWSLYEWPPRRNQGCCLKMPDSLGGILTWAQKIGERNLVLEKTLTNLRGKGPRPTAWPKSLQSPSHLNGA